MPQTCAYSCVQPVRTPYSRRTSTTASFVATFSFLILQGRNKKMHKKKSIRVLSNIFTLFTPRWLDTPQLWSLNKALLLLKSWRLSWQMDQVFRYHPQKAVLIFCFFPFPVDFCYFSITNKINDFRNPRSKPWALAIHEGCSLRPTRMSPPDATRPSTIALGATGSSIIHHPSCIIMVVHTFRAKIQGHVSQLCPCPAPVPEGFGKQSFQSRQPDFRQGSLHLTHR